jgi:hypothetical protein
MTISFCGSVAPAAGIKQLFIVHVRASYLATTHFGRVIYCHLVGRLAASSPT